MVTFMNEHISYSEFAETLNSTYTIVLNDKSLELRLIEISPLKDQGEFESFKLLFESAGKFLEQKIYTFEHATLGQQDLFLVPIASGPNRRENFQCYEAVLSRLKK